MFTEIITCLPDADEEEVAEDISKYNLVALPVVDEAGILLGIVTVDDAMEVMEENAEEEASDLAGKVMLGCIAGLLFLAVYTIVVLYIAGVM